MKPRPWKLAGSLSTLRAQINQIAPNRSKASDGTIGDAAHSNRTSDHNPDREGIDPDREGIVWALDITHDPKNGVDCNVLLDQLINSRDPRIKYIIWNRKIYSSSIAPWTARPYNGSNPHTRHLHISAQKCPHVLGDWNVRAPLTQKHD